MMDNEKVTPIEVECIYICHKCKRRYKEADKAMACFNGHKKAIEIIDQLYCYSESVPDSVIVKFDDGTTGIYGFIRMKGGN